MILRPLSVDGVYAVEIERREDERGFFARTFCTSEFEAAGLVTAMSQCNVSFNLAKGTLRGMHYQAEPWGEAKLVRCTRGSALDVVVDLRDGSPTRFQWTSLELTADNRTAIYIPPGLAHGFQTLEDDTELFYQMSAPYHAASSSGVRWNDPVFRIDWPIPDPVMSERDQTWPDCKA